MKPGKPIVLTAPLSETIDHAGYFIQMALASIPLWMEGIIDRKYPKWREVKRFEDGSAKLAPAGLRVLEKVLGTQFGEDSVIVCYPDDLDNFIGESTKVVAVSTHNPLGVTFAAGVYTSMFGSSKEPINSHYARVMFDRIKNSPYRNRFQVIVGGSGGWQILNTGSAEELGVDCVVDGRSEAATTIDLFSRAMRGEELPGELSVTDPVNAEDIVFPDKPTTFGVVEMTTGCGRRCKFCLPDLHPQIALPKEKIMASVAANVRNGFDLVSLATEDMFIWGQVGTGKPFYFPNREALLDLYYDASHYPGVKHFVLSHCTLAPAVVDPVLIQKLSEILLEKSPMHLPTLSSHPQKKALTPLLGLETGSVRMAKKIMPSKGVPFRIEDWPSIVIHGLETFNRNNWFPVMTMMVGSPGETDEDVKATLDLVYEIERRGLFGFLVPSIFTPLEGTRMQEDRGVSFSQDLSPLQWQLIMKCWKMNLKPGSYSWWGPMAFRLGGLFLWATRLRKTNGPNFFWPMMNFCSALPEKWMAKRDKIYGSQPWRCKSRAELLRTIRSNHWKHLHTDTGDVPIEEESPVPRPLAASG